MHTHASEQVTEARTIMEGGSVDDADSRSALGWLLAGLTDAGADTSAPLL